MPESASSEAWIARALRCPTCAAPLVLDESRGVLTCGHCGHRDELARGDAAAWHAFAPSAEPGMPVSRAEADLGPPTVSCAHCGALMMRRPGALTTQCLYCLSNLVLSEPGAMSDAIDGIVPFSIDGREARQRFATWLGGAWFAPGDLARAAKVEELDSIYVPSHFWRAEGRTEWRARVGILTTAAEDAAAGRKRPAGDPGHVRTRWEDASGVIDEPILELESASRVVSTKELEDLGGFDVMQLVAYHQGYLGTHDAELAALRSGESQGRMLERVSRSRADLAESRIDAERHKDFRAETTLGAVKWHLGLVPVYVVAYRYKGEAFRVLVHGGSGHVTGDHPLSPWKVGLLLVILAVLGLALLVALG